MQLSAPPPAVVSACLSSSAQLVEKIVRIAWEHGLEPASPAEAREILGLKGLDSVRF
jgi:hypothetical protein